MSVAAGPLEKDAAAEVGIQAGRLDAEPLRGLGRPDPVRHAACSSLVHIPRASRASAGPPAPPVLPRIRPVPPYPPVLPRLPPPPPPPPPAPPPPPRPPPPSPPVLPHPHPPVLPHPHPRSFRTRIRRFSCSYIDFNQH